MIGQPAPRDCPRCHGEGEITFNPSWPFDPQEETSEMCRACNGTGNAPIPHHPPRTGGHMSDFHDDLQDARAELVGDGIHLTKPEAVALSLNAQHGSDLYPYLRDRHPYGWSPFPVPTDGHLAPATSTGAPMTPDGLRTLPSPGARADGSTDIPDLAA